MWIIALIIGCVLNILIMIIILIAIQDDYIAKTVLSRIGIATLCCVPYLIVLLTVIGVIIFGIIVGIKWILKGE